jgi:Flp pilus assembly protein TadB
MNVILALVGAFGILATVISLISPRTVKLRGRDDYVEAEYGLAQVVQRKIDQAGLPITAGELIRTSAFLGVLGAVLGYVLSGAFVGLIFGGFAGVYLFWAYLEDRRDKQRVAYQAALADVAAQLIEGFREGGTIQAAVQKVIQFGPEVAREDWKKVAARLQGRMSISEALAPVLELRRDPVLDAIAQMLTVRVQKGGQATEALGGLLDLVRERVHFRERVKAELGQPTWEVRLVAALPFLVVAFLRVTTPEYSVFWSSILGQLSLVLSWGMVIVGYWMATKYIRKSMMIEESLGVVETPVVVSRREAGLPAEG